MYSFIRSSVPQACALIVLACAMSAKANGLPPIDKWPVCRGSVSASDSQPCRLRADIGDFSVNSDHETFRWSGFGLPGKYGSATEARALAHGEYDPLTIRVPLPSGVGYMRDRLTYRVEYNATPNDKADGEWGLGKLQVRMWLGDEHGGYRTALKDIDPADRYKPTATLYSAGSKDGGTPSWVKGPRMSDSLPGRNGGFEPLYLFIEFIALDAYYTRQPGPEVAFYQEHDPRLAPIWISNVHVGIHPTSP